MAHRRRSKKARKQRAFVKTKPSDEMKKALAYHRSGQLPRAAKGYRRILSQDPYHADAMHLLGVVAYQNGKPDMAVEHIQKAIHQYSGNSMYYNNLGNALMALGRLKEAVAAYQKALTIKPEDAEALINLANALNAQGAAAQAAGCCHKALEINPHHAEAYFNLGNVLMAKGDANEARACYRKALKLKPDYADAHNNLGNALLAAGARDEAIDQYQKALAANPDHGGAINNLASLFERANRLAEARALITRRLAKDPANPGINLVAARLERHEGRLEAAIARLSRFARPDAGPCLMEIHFELGLLYDRIQKSDLAFYHLTKGNQMAAQSATDWETSKAGYSLQIETLHAAFNRAWMKSWTPDAPADGAALIFIFGFQRSGTTLLGQMLDSHPLLQTLEEKPAVRAMQKAVATLSGGYPAALASLGRDEIERLRKVYFETVHRFTALRPGTILVDKYPLNIIHCGLIRRVFPNAKFILAIRHPYDVCLSCFMQNFKINAANAHFFTLEDGAELYARVIDLWRRYVQVLPLRYHLVKYEALVGDFETEARRLLEFLGVDWDDAVLHYDRHALRKGKIATPSYHQVTEKIYRRALYRWQRYDKWLAPAAGILKPYVQHFGYQE